MEATKQLDPSKHLVILDGVSVEGVKSISLTRPNEEASIENDLYSSATIIENPQGSIFNVEITISQESDGVTIMNIPVIAKTLTPFAIFNSSTQLPVVADEKARILFTGWTTDDTGSSAPTGFKVLGNSSKFIL